jgi:hypothetical protein
VANHLNDIAKIDADLVIETLKRWQASEKQESKEMAYIVSHSLRTLVKEGNAEALALLGFAPSPDIVLSGKRVCSDEVAVGEAVEFVFQIEAKENCALMLDYVLHFNTKSGKTSPKVHKIKKLHLSKGESIEIRKKHLFKANMTTRKLYAGKHDIELQINGKRYAMGSFNLKV